MAGFVVVMVVNVLLLGSAIYLMFFADPDRCVVCALAAASRESTYSKREKRKTTDKFVVAIDTFSAVSPPSVYT